ncbi:MAG: hypothetical protein Tsb0021_01460 [Chlamydiales bacterium]
MQRIFKFLYFPFVCMLIMNPLIAIAPQDEQNVKNDLRILELLPNLLCPLAVEPGIPEDFVLQSPEGTLDLYDWNYWGPEEDLKAYFEDPTSLSVPLIRVTLSGNVAQTGPNTFSDEETIKILEKENPDWFTHIKTQWGDYPVLAIQTQMEGKSVFVAWVGLNDPESGWTLMFNLVYPNKEGHPNKEDRELWENLITKTTQLKDADFFKAHGQDLQDGYTLVNMGGAKFKMIAEKRETDGTLQVVVIPLSSGFEYDYTDMMECAMGADWKYGEPMVKVYGEIAVNNENFESHTYSVASIFYKTVPDFSFKSDEESNLLIFQKTCDNID